LDKSCCRSFSEIPHLYGSLTFDRFALVLMSPRYFQHPASRQRLTFLPYLVTRSATCLNSDPSQSFPLCVFVSSLISAEISTCGQVPVPPRRQTIRKIPEPPFRAFRDPPTRPAAPGGYEPDNKVSSHSQFFLFRTYLGTLTRFCLFGELGSYFWPHNTQLPLPQTQPPLAVLPPFFQFFFFRARYLPMAWGTSAPSSSHSSASPNLSVPPSTKPTQGDDSNFPGPLVYLLSLAPERVSLPPPLPVSFSQSDTGFPSKSHIWAGTRRSAYFS